MDKTPEQRKREEDEERARKKRSEDAADSLSDIISTVFDFGDD